MLCDKHVLRGKLWQCRELFLGFLQNLSWVTEYDQVLTGRRQRRKAYEQKAHEQVYDCITHGTKVKHKQYDCGGCVKIRFTEVEAGQLVRKALFGPTQICGKLLQKCLVGLFAPHNAAGNSQGVDGGKAFFTGAGSEQDDGTLSVVHGIVVLSKGHTILFAGVPAEFQVGKGGLHIAAFVLICVSKAVGCIQ